MRRIFCGLAMLVAGSVVASAGMITVNAMDDIFYAGQVGTIGTNIGTQLGNFPNFIDLTSVVGASSIQFSSITGTVNWCGGNAACNAGADGAANPYTTTGTNLGPLNGLSSINFNGQVFFLVGVFTNGSVPGGTAPAGNTYTASSVLGSAFSPGLDQLFFIGDGQGTAGTQTFNVPTGATNLYLGFVDGLPGFTGTIGAYGDNSGTLTATFAITGVPEPATFSLIGLGLASIGLLRKRIRS